MRINFLGDSITAGAGASDDYHNFVYLLKSVYGIDAVNYGICGSRIAYQLETKRLGKKDDCYIERAKVMDHNADMVYVFGGTNDYGHGDAPFGNIDGEDVFTFCGAFNSLLSFLLKNYKKQNIRYIIPLPRYNQDCEYGEGNKKEKSFPLSKYIQAEKEILDKNGIKYYDFSDLFPEPETNKGDKLTADGLHPNNYGHELLAKVIYENLKKEGLI